MVSTAARCALPLVCLLLLPVGCDTETGGDPAGVDTDAATTTDGDPQPAVLVDPCSTLTEAWVEEQIGVPVQFLNDGGATDKQKSCNIEPLNDTDGVEIQLYLYRANSWAVVFDGWKAARTDALEVRQAQWTDEGEVRSMPPTGTATAFAESIGLSVDTHGTNGKAYIQITAYATEVIALNPGDPSKTPVPTEVLLSAVEAIAAQLHGAVVAANP